jgi:hypothetical protein
MSKLLIALDYDNTFTADPDMWSHFVRMSKSFGHECIVVTARRSTEENSEDINAMLDFHNCQMLVIFTDLGSKLRAVENRGINVNIWIDDDPKTLVDGH